MPDRIRLHRTLSFSGFEDSSSHQIRRVWCFQELQENVHNARSPNVDEKWSAFSDHFRTKVRNSHFKNSPHTGSAFWYPVLGQCGFSALALRQLHGHILNRIHAVVIMMKLRTLIRGRRAHGVGYRNHLLAEADSTCMGSPRGTSGRMVCSLWKDSSRVIRRSILLHGVCRIQPADGGRGLRNTLPGV